MVDWMIGVWEKYLRPKTWMDALNPEQQAIWAQAKRRYDRTIESENLKMAKARAEYDKAVRAVQFAQTSAREELKEVLRDFGMSNVPLLREVPEDQGFKKLFEELSLMGMNFRPPGDGQF
jgi:hypothetical protein